MAFALPVPYTLLAQPSSDRKRTRNSMEYKYINLLINKI